jgi:hypothetical protein
MQFREVSTLLVSFVGMRILRLFRCYDTLVWIGGVCIPGLSSAISRLVKNLVLSIYVSHVNSCIFWVIETQIDDPNRWIQRHILDKDGFPTSFIHRYARNL